MELTEGVPSPDQFRLWAGIGLVAGALERRVWARAARARTFPNTYILLTAAPGVGKQVVALVEQLWRSVTEPGVADVPVFKVAPSQMTKAALVDAIAKSGQLKILRNSVTREPVNAKYSSLLVAAEEFQVLLPTYDTEYIATLNLIFNNPEVPYQEVRRTGSVKELSIDRPQLNILAGVQPSYFTQTFPEEAWSTGLARRIMMIYAAEAPFQELFQDHVDCVEHPIWEQLRGQLAKLACLYGEMSWETAAAERLGAWHNAKGPPTPTHSKLSGYNNSRTMFAIKLSIISAIAGTGEMIIREEDVKRALVWLVTAEARMPDVFREMVGKSDSQIIDELHYMMILEQSKTKNQALTTAQLWEFLRQRVPSEKIEKIILSAERSGVISHPGGASDLWLARPVRGVRGVE